LSAFSNSGQRRQPLMLLELKAAEGGETLRNESLMLAAHLNHTACLT